MSSRRQDVWRNQERHYCSFCNAWMGSDRQSILIHDNGKKHRDNVEAKMKEKRLQKMQEEKQNKALAGVLAQIEKTAAASHAKDVGSGVYHRAPAAGVLTSSVAAKPQRPSSSVPQPHKKQQQVSPNEKQSWEERKQKRQDRKRPDETNDQQAPTVPTTKRTIGPDEGHYTIDSKTYLEGPTFGTLLEEDMPIQIWTGFHAANLTEKRLPEKQHLWKNGLVVKTRLTSNSNGETSDVVVVADIAYLLQSTDTDETLEKSVPADRLRIVLGADDCIPDTLEEARLTAMGGEIVQENQEQQGNTAEVDENTGLSSWGTVSIRRTTQHQELKEERARLRAKRRAEVERVEQAKKEADGRRMEEAKVENANDSALGAYDVWSSGKGGYKGVEIQKETKLSVADTATSLSQGKGNVGFKKRSGSSLFKKAKRKQNRRTTSADDDDD